MSSITDKIKRLASKKAKISLSSKKQAPKQSGAVAAYNQVAEKIDNLPSVDPTLISRVKNEYALLPKIEGLEQYGVNLASNKQEITINPETAKEGFMPTQIKFTRFGRDKTTGWEAKAKIPLYKDKGINISGEVGTGTQGPKAGIRGTVNFKKGKEVKKSQGRRKK